MKVPMVDLVGQYQKIKPEVEAAFEHILGNASFINGPAVACFQQNLQDYLGIRHVIPCANGTDALQVSLMALGLKPGDEVITSTFTFIATAEVIALLKLKPVLVDVLEDTFNLDPEAVKRAITPRTKAVIPVHLFGQCADMTALMEIASDHELYVIEDNAQAIGADFYTKEGETLKTGTIGHIGCTSFFPSKNLGAYGDGGAIFTNNDEWAEQLRIVVNHGMKVRYYHDYVGVNSRLDSLQAAVLDIKLKYLDEYAAARRKAAEYYNHAFAASEKLITPFTAPFTSHVFHQYTLKTKDIDRQGLHEHLMSKGIANAIYYPVPLHMQKAYQDPRYKEGDFPVSEKLAKTVLSLPMHTELKEEQLAYVTQSVLEFTEG